jgi:hypothetical protein
MKKRIIRINYRKIIDASSQKAWDKYVFESSYKEFLMQAQFYNQDKKYSTFADLLINTPGSEKLHFLVSSSIVGYLGQLNGKIPDVLNNLGKHFLEFKNYQFEIINSDVNNNSAHQVAITFYSEALIWHKTIDNYILISPVNGENTADGVLTDLLQLQPFFCIYSLKEIEYD